MSLESMIDPNSVAVIGATDREGSVGLALCRNLKEGERDLFFINPHRDEVLGQQAHDSIKGIEPVDLVVIAVPAEAVLQVAKEIPAETKAAIVISAGFGESGEEGEQRERQLKKILQEKDIRFLGPNCLGVISPATGLNASFAPATPQQGAVAFLSQSGALIDSVIDKSLAEGYGFSSLVSLGNQADVNVQNLLDYFKNDQQTKAIALYLEGISQAQKSSSSSAGAGESPPTRPRAHGKEFIKKAQQVTEEKPVVVLKSGVTEQGKQAVSSHTGSLAGNAEIYEAAFRKAGIFQVHTIEQLLQTSLTLAKQPSCGNNIGIVTNGGACGVMAADWCGEYEVNLAELKEETINKLEQSEVMNPAFSKSNPLDIVGDADAERYRVAIESLMQQEDIEGLIVIQTLQAMTDSKKNAEVIVEAQKKWDKPILPCFIGGKMTKPGVDVLLQNEIPNFTEPKRAVLAMKALMN